ncbi:MAG TPA: hypothetical protein VFA63_06665 [Pseudonocardiaceae bacterium]|jgi:hypothetical protein|nr:hypothetical protein [Pseudonocardiaceae bacterium]
MTMGDRIKTRQQLLSEQADAAQAREVPGDDRHDHSADPCQAPDSSVQPMQECTNVQSSLDALQQEVTKLRERMAVIKQEVTDEVNRTWVSPWRTLATFELKVKTRLTGNQEYRSLQNRVRDAETGLPAQSDAATVPGTTR